MDAVSSAGAGTTTSTSQSEPGRGVKIKVTEKVIRRLINDLTGTAKDGRQLSEGDRIVALRELAERGALTSLEPLLPGMLTLNSSPYELSEHKPFAPLFRTLMPQKQVWVAGRQVSKCVPLSAIPTIWRANGEIVGTQDIRVGDMVLAVNGLHQRTFRKVLAVHDTGLQEVFRIRTRLGAEVEHTAQHRMRTLGGFTEVQNLQPGSRVAGVRRGGRFAGRDRVISNDRIAFTAYMLGDGSSGVSGNFNFTSACRVCLREVAEIAKRQAGLRSIRRKAKGKARQVNLSQVQKGLRTWVTEDNGWGKYAWEKTIPSWVFQLSRPQTRLFISRLWATDGCIKGPRTISYTSTSRELARGVKSLLAKFGVPCSIAQRPTGYRDKYGEYIPCRDAWVVRVETRDGLRTFLEQFDVPGKPAFTLPITTENNNRDTIPIEAQDWLDEVYQRRHGPGTHGSLYTTGLRAKFKYPPTRAKFSRYIKHLKKIVAPSATLRQLESLLCEDLIWDEVISVERVGIKPTVDLEVEEDHTFVYDGVYTHNSTSLAAHGVVLSNAIPDFKTLFVTPLYEQIRRFSTNYVRPFIDRSPIRYAWVGTSTEKSVLQRSFKNLSTMIFSFALLDADRCRGISCDRLAIDEIQDMDPAHLPIIEEALSHSRYKLIQQTGTPKSLDNPICGSFMRSSQAEWFIPCQASGCNTWNIPSKEYHLADMIGPMHPHISEKYPGVVCHKCRRPINPALGHWVHKHKDRRWSYAGYHVPQLLLPLHYADPGSWSQLLYKQAGGSNMTEATFWNEVLGESVDTGQKLVSETELKAASVLPWKNNPKSPSSQVRDRLKGYETRILAIDWGGGGEAGVSHTVIALMGFTSTGKIDVLWGTRLLYGAEHLREAAAVLHFAKMFDVDFIAHDYTGAGTVRDTVMIQAGFEADKMRNMVLQRTAYQDLVVYKPPSPFHHRPHYVIDKARTLLYTCQAIKLGLLRFFQYDSEDKDTGGLMMDFLALVAEKTETRLAGDVFTVTRNTMISDDFAQAINIGASALWHEHAAWPNMARAAGFARISPQQLQAAGNFEFGWENDFANPFFDMP
jgi:hypothetical protein